MTAAAVIIIFSVLAYFFLFLWMCRQDDKLRAGQEEQPLAEPETPLARAVWSAHTANRRHEAAIATGTAEEIDDAVIELIYYSEALVDCLNSMKQEKTR